MVKHLLARDVKELVRGYAMELVMIVVLDVLAKQILRMALDLVIQQFLVFLAEVIVLVIVQDVLAAIVAAGESVKTHVH